MLRVTPETICFLVFQISFFALVQPFWKGLIGCCCIEAGDKPRLVDALIDDGGDGNGNKE